MAETTDFVDHAKMFILSLIFLFLSFFCSVNNNFYVELQIESHYTAMSIMMLKPLTEFTQKRQYECIVFYFTNA